MRWMTEEEIDFKMYSDTYKEYSDLLENMIDDHVRNAHRRLLVSKMMEEYVLEGGELRQETYINYLRLVDAWFSFEVFLKSVKRNGFGNQSNSKTDILRKEILVKSGCNEILESVVIGLWDLPESSELTKKLNYYASLIQDESVSSSQKRNIESIIDKVRTHNLTKITHAELFSLCYAIRNSYAHNGETARSGTSSYGIKIELLNLCYHYLLRIMYRYNNYMYAELTKEID